ncbi:MAG: hypothetical protein FJ267_19595, partial [Planctomycetes bacterium]|nr:hypothetical protein [Planctomycetota bacterium]
MKIGFGGIADDLSLDCGSLLRLCPQQPAAEKRSGSTFNRDPPNSWLLGKKRQQAAAVHNR